MPDFTPREQLAVLRERVVGLAPRAVSAAIRPNELALRAISAAVGTFEQDIQPAIADAWGRVDEINDHAERWATMQRVPEPRKPLDLAATLDSEEWLRAYSAHMSEREVPSAVTLMEDFGIDPRSVLSAYYPQSVLMAAILYPRENPSFGVRRDRKMHVPLAAIVAAEQVADWSAQFPKLNPVTLGNIIRKHRQNPREVPVAARGIIDEKWTSRAERIRRKDA